MKNTSLLIAATASALLSGCVTAEQMAARDDAVCGSYGLTLGSPGYAQCRMQLDQNRRQAYAAAVGQMNANFQAQQAANDRSTQIYLDSVRSNAVQPLQPLQMPKTTNCIRTSNITETCTTY